MNTPPLRLPIQRPGRRTLALLLGLTLAGAAAAQWQWRDANGSRVFSDTPPPPHISESQILKRPPGAAPAAVAPAPAPAAAAPAAPGKAAPGTAGSPVAAGKPGDKPTELDDKIKREEEQKRKADEQRIAKMKAENCQRARQYKATIDAGQRISRTNAQGEREILDEKGIAEEARRNQQAIAENCG